MASSGSAECYTRHGEFSDPGEHQALFESLPRDVAGLCRVIQGLLIHDYFGLHLYGRPPPSFHCASRQTLPVSERIDAILAEHDQPIGLARDPADRSVGTCRDFALMLCAMLRQQSIPARVRCGFAKYFHPPSYEDHWVCQYWKPDCRRWALADAQLDGPHQAHLCIDFDTTDVPRDLFVFPWLAWRMCRSGTADPKSFGHGEESGAWFIQVNLARDLLSLCKQEVSAWDTWRDNRKKDRALDGEAMLYFDQIADITETISNGLGSPERSASPILGSLSVPPWQR